MPSPKKFRETKQKKTTKKKWSFTQNEVFTSERMQHKNHVGKPEKTREKPDRKLTRYRHLKSSHGFFICGGAGNFPNHRGPKVSPIWKKNTQEFFGIYLSCVPSMYQEFWEDFAVQLGGRCGQTVDSDFGFRCFAPDVWGGILNSHWIFSHSGLSQNQDSFIALHSLKENS